MPSRSLQSLIPSQGVELLSDGAVRWRLWAPRQATAELVLWIDGRRTVRRLEADGEGHFMWREPDLGDRAHGLRYAYRIPEFDRDLPDPASVWQPDGVHEPSAVFDARRFRWSDAAWPGIRLADLVLYELHVGVFTPEGTLAAAAKRLPELADLGVTAVELMPVAQFPGSRGWGYDGVHLNAVQNSYGGPEALQHFVDAAHRTGLGVVLDVVYNHFGPEGNYAGLLGHYFTPRYHTPWGDALNYDGCDSEPVRRLVVDSACRWVRDFHIDGLRLDAVQTIYDFGAEHILAEVADAMHVTAAECGRTVVVTAETDQNDVRLVRSPEQGGYGLDAVWSDDFHHALHALLTGQRSGYYEDFGDVASLVKSYNSVFTYDGVYSPHRRRRHGSQVGDLDRGHFVVCIQNHDQVGNRPRGDRLGTLLPPAAQRLAACLLLVSPCTPLLFMGEEYGETRPFPYFCSYLDERLVDSVRAGRAREFADFVAAHRGELFDPQAESTFALAKLDWQWPEGTSRAGLRRLYRTLLRARREFAPLADRRYTQARISDDNERLLILTRGRKPQALVYANLSDRPAALRLPAGARVLLSSEAAEFGGARRSTTGHFSELLPYELVMIGGPKCPSFP